MHERCGCGLLSWWLASLVGCTSPATSADPADEQPSANAPAGQQTTSIRPTKPAATGESAVGSVAIRFVNGPPGLVVSCEDCPGLPAGNHNADQFPPITASIGTTINIKLTAPGFVSREHPITLDSTNVDVPVALEPLDPT